MVVGTEDYLRENAYVLHPFPHLRRERTSAFLPSRESDENEHFGCFLFFLTSSSLREEEGLIWSLKSMEAKCIGPYFQR